MAAPRDSGQSQPHVSSREYAEALDARDPLRHMSREFAIPSKAELKARRFDEVGASAFSSDTKQVADARSETRDGFTSLEPSIYLCGNSLGLQPKLTSTRIQQYLTTWATQGVFGHFKRLAESPLPTWLHADSSASDLMFPIVGGTPTEVAVMDTLTANLHFLMSAFYKPDINKRHKIIIESKAFPSDHYAVESQILHHGLSPSMSMVTIEPPDLEKPILTTEYILSVIFEHASTTSILLLPGIQFYTGQLFDIPSITKAARTAGIFVIFDLAHAVGNVPLHLHDWDVDAAAWCSYKYLNSGPGGIGGLFVHDRHTENLKPGSEGFVNRLSGWWGSEKDSRFDMANTFAPMPGVASFQLSNPSVLDITALNASLEVFRKAGGMVPIREKSLLLTAYLEDLLLSSPYFESSFSIITPHDPEQRGAQLSVKLSPSLLAVVMHELEERGIILDERKPDVIRVAPTPLYNSFTDIWEFRRAFDEALNIAIKAKEGRLQAKGESHLEMTT